MRHLAAAISLALLPFTGSVACECPPPVEGVTNFSRAEIVMVGVPLSVQETTPLGSTRRVRIKVLEILKGADTEVVTLWTRTQVSACGINFVVKEKYLIYAVASSEGLVAYQCEGTKRLDASSVRELAELRQSRPNKVLQPTRETRAPER